MTPSGTVHMIHDRDGNVIAETDGAGNTVREYIWLPASTLSEEGATEDGGLALPLAVIADVTTMPVTYFVKADHLNRPIMMTDAAKQVVWQAIYLPFGGDYQITGSASLDARFPGQWFQLESGLAYNWHRHYDASLGRYTQADPLGFPDGPDRYAYAVNSPQMYVDEEGHFVQVFVPLLLGAGIGAGIEYFTDDCPTLEDLAIAAALGAFFGSTGPSGLLFGRSASGFKGLFNGLFGGKGAPRVGWGANKAGDAQVFRAAKGSGKNTVHKDLNGMGISYGSHNTKFGVGGGIVGGSVSGALNDD